nr:PAS domain S-box protein [Caldimonas mangrovi]
MLCIFGALFAFDSSLAPARRWLVAAVGLVGALSFLVVGRLSRRALRRAAEHDARFNTLLGLAADWYWEQDEHFRFTRLSASFDEISGLEAKAVLGKCRWEIPDAVVTPQEWVAHRTALQAHLPFRDFVMRRTQADGRMVHLSISGEPIFDADGRFCGYWGIGQNITEQRAATLALASSERRYRNLFARSPLALLIHREGRIISANEAAARMFGYGVPDDLVGIELLSLYDVASQALVQRRVLDLEALPIGESLPVVDLVALRRDGSPVDVTATGSRVDLPDGPAIESIYLDVTQRRQAESALLHSEAMLSRLFLSSPDVITVTDPDTGRYVMVNPGFTRVIGYEPHEVIGRTVLELGMLQSQEQREHFLSEIRRNGSVQDLLMPYRAKAGHTVLVQLSGAIFEVDGKRYLLVLARDVTERERSRAEYKAILDNASVGIALVLRGRFHQANRRFEEMLGWAPGELIGQHVRAIWPSDAEFERVSQLTREVMSRHEPLDFEWEMFRRDDGRFWGRCRARRVEDAGTDRGATIWIVEDITEQRRAAADLAAAKEQAEAANRAKSAFLANMSHEIRTPLHGVLGLAQLALGVGIDDHRREEYLRRIVDSAQTLSTIISDILDLSKIEAGRLQLEAIAFDLPELLQTLHRSYVEQAAGKQIQLVLKITDDLPQRVIGDPVRTQQILGNFISNALKFTDSGRVQMMATPLGDERMRFEVHDTGPGIDPDVLQRLFKPFTQADESISRRYGGTGLGLSICRELAHLMGGEVGVDSTPGQGSVFWAELALPAAGETAAPAVAPPPAADSLQGLRVLVVEDNPVNMMIAAAMLEQWGVEVAQARTGQEALDVIDAEQGRFDAVLMDVHMPGMSGFEATQMLRRRYDAQALPIIALTAAALVSEQERTRAVGMNDFVAKPIDLHRLHATLERWARRPGANRSA